MSTTVSGKVGFAKLKLVMNGVAIVVLYIETFCELLQSFALFYDQQLKELNASGHSSTPTKSSTHQRVFTASSSYTSSI